MPLSAPRRLDPALIEGVRNFSERCGPLDLADNRQDLGCVGVRKCSDTLCLIANHIVDPEIRDVPRKDFPCGAQLLGRRNNAGQVSVSIPHRAGLC